MKRGGVSNNVYNDDADDDADTVVNDVIQGSAPVIAPITPPSVTKENLMTSDTKENLTQISTQKVTDPTNTLTKIPPTAAPVVGGKSKKSRKYR
jgi:hypothetical protein